MTAPTVPEPYGVEHYADRIRTAVAGGGDLYVYSYALAISLSTSPALPAEVVERLRNIRTAVNLVLEEQLAALSAPHPVDPTGLNYSREPDEVDDPTPVSPARGGAPHVVATTNGGLVDETPGCEPPGCPPGFCVGADDCRRDYDGDGDEVYPDDLPHAPLCACGCRDDDKHAEVATLSAAIRFSEARREAFRLTGRTTPERLRAATLDLLHDQAVAEHAERAQRADLREGEQGRVTNPKLARFLAKKEEARREARHFLGLEESAAHGQPVSEAR